MPSKLYELRVFRGEHQVRNADRLLETLDLDSPNATNNLLRRHLLAAAERERMHRRDAHLLHLRAHEVRAGRAERDVAFQFSVPVEASCPCSTR